MGKKSSRKGLNFKKGDRIFAKIKGFPYWPARVETLPNESVKKFKIMFYGTYQTNLIKPDCILPFNEETKQQHGQKKQKSFIDAMWEIENDPNLKSLKKSKKQMNKNDDISVVENIELDTEEKLNEKNTSPSHSSSTNNDEGEIEIEAKSIDEKSDEKNADVKEPIQNIDKIENETTKRSQRYSNRYKNEKIDEDSKEEKISNNKKSKKSKSSVPIDVEYLENTNENNESNLNTENKTSTVETDNQNDEDVKENNTIDKNKRHSNRNKRSIEQFDEIKSGKRLRRSIKILEDDQFVQSNDNKEDSVSVKNDIETDCKEENLDTNNSSTSDSISSSRSRSTSSSSEFSRNEGDHNAKPPKKLNKNHAKDTTTKNSQNVKKRNEKFDSDGKKLLNKTKSNLDSNSPKINITKKKLKSNDDNFFNMSSSNNKELTHEEQLKNKKLIDKKLKFLNNVRIQLALLRMDFEIKKSLRVDHTDVNYCCLIMQDLIKLPFKKSHLFITPVIVDTIKKCRKFKNSDKVRDTSSECYNKFCKVLNLNPDDTFSSEFEKEKCKYLNEKMSLIKKQRSIAYKLLTSDRRKNASNNSNTYTPTKLSSKSLNPKSQVDEITKTESTVVNENNQSSSLS